LLLLQKLKVDMIFRDIRLLPHEFEVVEKPHIEDVDNSDGYETLEKRKTQHKILKFRVDNVFFSVVFASLILHDFSPSLVFFKHNLHTYRLAVGGALESKYKSDDASGRYSASIKWQDIP